jgi:integrase
VWRFLLGTGVRWGEAAALTWDDVDIDSARPEVPIQRAATRIRGRVFVTAPKTRAGRRTIPLTMDATAALKQQQNFVRKLKLAAEPGTWSDENGKLVFPNPTGGLLRSNRVLAEFERVRGEGGLPAKRLHDLRHTYATLLFARDVHPKIAQDLLGHTRIDMTLRIYTGSVPQVAREAVARLDDVFDRASGT